LPQHVVVSLYIVGFHIVGFYIAGFYIDDFAFWGNGELQASHLALLLFLLYRFIHSSLLFSLK